MAVTTKCLHNVWEEDAWVKNNMADVVLRYATGVDYNEDVYNEISSLRKENAHLRLTIDTLKLKNERRSTTIPPIKDVIYNAPATIVLWKDGTKTVVKCQEPDGYDPEKGLAMCLIKKMSGNKGNYNDIFRKWAPPEPEETSSALDDILNKLRKEINK